MAAPWQPIGLTRQAPQESVGLMRNLLRLPVLRTQSGGRDDGQKYPSKYSLSPCRIQDIIAPISSPRERKTNKPFSIARITGSAVTVCR